MVRHRTRPIQGAAVSVTAQRRPTARNKQATGVSPREHRYEIGYRKPPKHTRFKPGRSGNPRGRPRESKNLKTDLVNELQRKVPLTENGKTVLVRLQLAYVKNLILRAIKGDARADRTLLELISRFDLADADDGAAERDISTEDREILDRFLSRVSKPARRTGGKS